MDIVMKIKGFNGLVVTLASGFGFCPAPPWRTG
jgi:hypothetical protein